MAKIKFELELLAEVLHINYLLSWLVGLLRLVAVNITPHATLHSPH